MAKDPVEIIEALASGYDPVSGNRIPDESVIHEPDVIRALYTVLRLMESRECLTPTGEQRPARAGEYWDDAEDERLRREFAACESFSEIAEKHQRTRGAILSRLNHMGLLYTRTVSNVVNETKIRPPLIATPEWKRERPNAGKRWSDEEHEQVRRLWASNRDIPSIALEIGRGENSIEVKLYSLGLLEP